MSATLKKKLCWNCEGNVTHKEENCPFCGVYLHPESITGKTVEIEDHTPPYRAPNYKSNDPIPAVPYNNEQVANGENTAVPEEEVSSNLQEKKFSSEENIKNTLYALTLLMAGSVFLLFSLVLILFSKNGNFSLSWNGDYWFIYLLASLPMLFLGWKVCHRLSDDEV